jgi:MFS transporter, PAT family, beta-lactamase induction signal transducer AmpG
VRGTTSVRLLSLVALLYVIEGFPMGVYADVWPVFLRRQDVSNTVIGLLSSLYLAWSVKVLWSPLVDRYGDARHWIAAALCAMAAALAVLAVVPTESLALGLFAVFAFFCLASATQDIAIDAYTIGLTPRGQEGPVNSVRVAAYRVGLIAAGTGLMFLPAWVGWGGTFAAAAVASSAMALMVLACPPVQRSGEARPPALPELLRWAAQPGVAGLLGFVLLYRVGDRAMGPMVRPFWVDSGFSNEQIGLYANGFGQLATLLGALVGGAAVARLGIPRALLVLGAFALGSNFAYALAALPSPPRLDAFVAASLVESLCSGLASVAFLSFLMRITEKQHAAAHYALLTAVYALSGAAVAAPSGWLTDRLGYPAYFALTAGLALPAFMFLPAAARFLAASERARPEPASEAAPPDRSSRPEPRPASPPPRAR